MKCATALAILGATIAMTFQLSAQDNPEPKVMHHKYKLVDLGTFGGPISYINPEGNGGPYVNRGPFIAGYGAAVGLAQTNVPLPLNSNLFICYPGVNVYHGLRWRNGKATDLRALPPAHDHCSDALGINDRGEIAGISENDVIDPLLGVTEVRAVLWKDGKIIDLGTLGGNASAASSVNNHGQVVGFALNAIPDPFSIYGLGFEGSTNSTQTRAFLWQEGTMQDLGTLGGPDALAAYVNQNGQILGFSYTPSLSTDPFVWADGKMIDLGTLGGTLGLGLALNNKGQVAGQSNLPGDSTMHPFFWDRGVLTDIGTFGGSNGAANSLNDAGEVVGVADFPGDQLHDAFLWKSGEMTDLGNLGRTSAAFSINSQGQVVGASLVSFGTVHGFLWERGEIVDLNDLVFPKSQVQLVEPNAIADSGEIAVNGLPEGCSDQDTCEHAYVMIPIN